MFDGLTPDLAPRLVLAIGGVGIAFVILVLVLIFLKRRNSPLFIKGGKAREPRLMVLDAAAVDPKRRLVLIRRDDVEHLIMIGGPTDIVIETGITDRSAATAPARNVAVDEVSTPRAVSVPAAEVRPTPPVAEHRPEPARPVMPVQPERPAATPVNERAATPVVQPVARTVTPPAGIQERVTPSIDRYMERPSAERQAEARPETKGVSAMGSVLYGEDREPMTGAKSIPPVAETPSAAPDVVRRTEPEALPVRQPVQPLPSTAEAILDAARDRVLPNLQTAATTQTVTVSDAEKALATRMEAMRRVQSTQTAAAAASPTLTQPIVPAIAQPVVQRTEPQVETPRPKDAELSDFEKLLEAELDANGVFGKPTPEVRSDARVTTAVPANAAVPPVRVSPPITGATADVTSEEEVARLLGEIAINRKP